MKTQFRRYLMSAAAGAALWGGLAQAQDSKQSLFIPSQPLSKALAQLARKMDIQFVYVNDVVNDSVSSPLHGQFDADTALRRILNGTGLTYEFVDSDTIVIRTAKSALAGQQGQDRASKPLTEIRQASAELGHQSQTEASARVAPEPQAPRSPSAGAVEELVVTARKRSELLTKVPIAITAIPAAEIERASSKRLNDIQQFTPGFYVNDQGFAGSDYRSVPNLIIRGLNLPSALSSQPAALLFVDGVPVLSGEPGDLSNVERVEVLRGPQSAYFGRAAFSGAVSMVTREPNMEHMQGSIYGQYGKYNDVEIGASFEGPLISDKLGFRVSGRYDRTDGQYQNTSPQGGRFGDRSTKMAGLTLLFTPSDSLKIKLRADQTQYDDGLGASTKILTSQMTCNANGGKANNWICGQVFPFPENLLGANTPFDSTILAFAQQTSLFNGDVFLRHGGLARRIRAVSGTVDYTVTDAITLSSITGYHTERSQSYRDETNRDATTLRALFPYGNTRFGYPAINFYRNDSYEDFSQELRGNYQGGGPLTGTIGANYVYGRSRVNQFGDTSFGLPSFPSFLQERKTSTVGIFSGLYYDITPKLHAGAEGRYQWDTITANAWTTFTAVGSPASTLQNTFGSFTPRLSLTYDIGPDSIVFANWSRGTRAGTFNVVILSLNPAIATELVRQTGASVAVAPEKLSSFELGVKGTALDHRLTGSLVGYYGTLSNEQVARSIVIQVPGLPVSFPTVITNSGKTELKGIEAETTFNLNESITAQGSFSWNDVRFKTYFCQICVSITGNGNVTGHQFPGAPKFKGSAIITYRRPISGDYVGFVRTEYLYEGTKFATEANLAETGARNIVNLRFGVESDALRVEGYVTNLFQDKHPLAIAQVFDTSNFAGNAIGVILPDKRRYGIRTRYSF